MTRLRALAALGAALAPLTLAGCIVVHGPEFQDWLDDHVDDVCIFESESYGQGAQVCMSGQRMECDEHGKWREVGDC